MAGTFVVGQVAQEFLRVIYTCVNADAIDFMVGNNPIANVYFFVFGVVAYYIIKEKKSMNGIFVCILGITFFSVINSPWYPYWTLIAVIFIVLSEEVEITLPENLNRVVVFCSNISFDLYLVHLEIIKLLDRMEICDTYGSLIFVIAASILTVTVGILVYNFDRGILQRMLKK